MTRLFRIVLRSGIGLLVLATIAGALVWWYAAGTHEVSGTTYQTATVSRGPLELTVSSTGTLAAVETVIVGTEVSGTVAKVLVDYNDRVTKGQVLAILNATDRCLKRGISRIRNFPLIDITPTKPMQPLIRFGRAYCGRRPILRTRLSVPPLPAQSSNAVSMQDRRWRQVSILRPCLLSPRIWPRCR